jgi:hypothetical protein
VLLGHGYAIPTQHFTHIFAVAGIASQFLCRNRKNVSYLNTLSAICPKFGQKYGLIILVQNNRIKRLKSAPLAQYEFITPPTAE